MPVESLEGALLNVLTDYLQECFDIELLDRFGYAGESEDKVGIFGGVTFSEPALPGPSVAMDSSGFYRCVFIFTIKTYAMDDRQGLFLKSEAGKLRSAIHREGLADFLNNFTDDLNIISVLQGASDQGESGNFRTFDLTYTIILNTQPGAVL